jgi:hypothetical protein
LAFIQLRAAFLDMTYLPVRLMPVVRHMRPGSVLAAPDTLFNYELVSLLSMLIRILALLVAALLLFRCGPVDGRFLAGNTEQRTLRETGSSAV